MRYDSIRYKTLSKYMSLLAQGIEEKIALSLPDIFSIVFMAEEPIECTSMLCLHRNRHIKIMDTARFFPVSLSSITKIVRVPILTRTTFSTSYSCNNALLTKLRCMCFTCASKNAVQCNEGEHKCSVLSTEIILCSNRKIYLAYIYYELNLAAMRLTCRDPENLVYHFYL